MNGRSFWSTGVDELNRGEDDLGSSVDILLLERRGRSSSSDQFCDEGLSFEPLGESAEGVDLRGEGRRRKISDETRFSVNEENDVWTHSPTDVSNKREGLSDRERTDTGRLKDGEEG